MIEQRGKVSNFYVHMVDFHSSGHIMSYVQSHYYSKISSEFNKRNLDKIGFLLHQSVFVGKSWPYDCGAVWHYQDFGSNISSFPINLLAYILGTSLAFINITDFMNYNKNLNKNGNLRSQDFYDCAQEVTDMFNHTKCYKM